MAQLRKGTRYDVTMRGRNWAEQKSESEREFSRTELAMMNIVRSLEKHGPANKQQVGFRLSLGGTPKGTTTTAMKALLNQGYISVSR